MASDLTANQREAFTQYQTMHHYAINQYKMDQVKDYFFQIICSQQTNIENPSLRKPVHQRGYRSFSILEDYGECDGHYGFWAQDDEDGAEGVLSAEKDVFFVWEFPGDACRQLRVVGEARTRGLSTPGSPV